MSEEISDFLEKTLKDFNEETQENIRKIAEEDYNKALNELGHNYEYGISIEKKTNIEKAIECYEIAVKNSSNVALFNLASIYEKNEKYRDEKKAIECYEALVRKGNKPAILRLGDIYKNSKNEESKKGILNILKIALKENNQNALPELVNIYFQNKEDNNKKKEILDSIWEKAKENDENALIILAEIYKQDNTLDTGIKSDIFNFIEGKRGFQYDENGKPIVDNEKTYENYFLNFFGEKYLEDEENKQKAFDYFKKGTELGDPYSTTNLGYCYENGIGIEKNEKKALEYYEKGAELGNIEACMNSAFFYENGKGTDRDEEKAIKYYEMAAGYNNTEAMYELGKIYLNNKDFEKAKKYFKEATAIDGHALSAFHLALCYENGKGEEKNLESAAKFYEMASNQGDNYSKINLAYCYENGIGVEKNEEKADQLYKEAIEADKTVLRDLAYSYEIGEDDLIEKDFKKARRFLEKAVELGDEKARNELKKLISRIEKEKEKEIKKEREKEIEKEIEKERERKEEKYKEPSQLCNNYNDNKGRLEKAIKRIDDLTQFLSKEKGSISVEKLNDMMKEIPEKKDLLENKEFLKATISEVSVGDKQYKGFGGSINYSPNVNGGKLTISFEEGGFFIDQLKRMGNEEVYEFFKNGAIVINNCDMLGKDGIADLLVKFKTNPFEAYKEISNNKDIELKYLDKKNNKEKTISNELNDTVKNSFEKVTNVRNTISDIEKYNENIKQNKDNNVNQGYEKVADFVKLYYTNMIGDDKINKEVQNETTLKNSNDVGKQVTEFLKTMNDAISNPKEQKQFLDSLSNISKLIDSSKTVDINNEKNKEIFINCIGNTLNKSLNSANVDIQKEQKVEINLV